MIFARPAVALVRAVSSRFDACLRESKDARIDIDKARVEHAAYVAVLRELGIRVEVVDPNDAHADGCFVEDTAVVTGAHAVLTTPGAPSRRAETREVLPALARHCHVHEMQGDARLDGGDVLRVDDLLFIGLSRRTNQAGAEFLSRVAAKDGLRTTTVPLASGLHLKSVCSVVDASTIVCAPSLDAHIADGLRSSACALVQVPEEPGANVLGLADAVVVSAAAPLTAALLRSCGKRVIELDVSEIHKADGALTCLSVRIPRAGCWSG